MTIPVKTLEMWKALKSPADAREISEKIPGGYPAQITRALNSGKCNNEVFEAMAAYYEARAKKVKKVL